MPYVPEGHNAGNIPNPDKNLSYRWIATDGRLREHLLSHGDRPGFKLQHGKTVPETIKLAEKIGLDKNWVNELTNRIQWGDVVLAAVPRAEMNKRKQELLRIADDSADYQTEKFMAEARAKGITPRVYDSPEEMQDRKEFAARSGHERTTVPANVAKQLAAD